MVNSNPDKNKDNSSGPDRDPNPFVAFRQFADDKFASVFGQISDPWINLFDKQEKAWRNAQSEALRRFEASYERAINPERRQSDRRDSDDPVRAAPVPRYRSLEAVSDTGGAPISGEGPDSHGVGMMRRSPAEEDKARAAATAVRDEDYNRLCHGDGHSNWSWSWSPWGSGPGVGRCRNGEGSHDNENGSAHARSHSFGPWYFGPFHISSGSVSAMFPRDLEQDMKNMVAELEQLGRDVEHAERRPMLSPDGSGDTPSSYSPLQLRQDKTMGPHLDWCRAFEDLMVTERNGQLPASGGTTDQGQHPSWLVRMMKRDLIDSKSAWHRDLFYRNELSPYEDIGEAPDGNKEQDHGPETELDYYERQELANSNQSSKNALQIQQKPDVLSTVATVERVTLADGSTTIKRTLKRRFADGTEESEDSTEHAPLTRSVEHEPSGGLVEGAKALSQKGHRAEPAKGWFW